MKLNINKETIKKGLLGVLEKLSKHLFLVLIFLLFVDLILGGLFFWKYCIKGVEKEIMMPPPLMINRATLNRFSAKYAAKEKIFQVAATKQYLDPFRGIIVEEPSAD